ncbi:MAG: hypothetical protein KDD06_22565 [Phaeodactylibacter sp.]|nr:hypothetical protein [Phaeodactylibacter sp.]MCB9286541.1 hypothetical protein [Lewinellaceae bacterium]
MRKVIWGCVVLLLNLMGPGCANDNAAVSAGRADNFKEPDPEQNIEGEKYTDSMARALVNEAIENSRPVEIDSFRDLHSFQREKFEIKAPAKIDMALVEKYESINNPLTKARQKLLRVTDYFSDLTFSDRFSMYLFYNHSMESHYGNSIELITIANNSNQTSRLTLAREYLSEGYECVIESELVGKDEIHLTKTEYFGIANSRAEVDSTSVARLIYRVGENGQLRMAGE